MKNRVIDVQSYGTMIAVERGLLKIRASDREPAMVPLDTIGVVLIGQGTSISVNAISSLLEHGATVLLTGPNHLPQAQIWPLQGHYLQRERMLAQAELSLPFKKNLWKQVVTAKIGAQSDALRWVGADHLALHVFLKSVSSGDATNAEAQAARKYWPLLFGKDFRRVHQGDDEVNSMLNYGYAILRAACARAVCAAGLHPSFSLFHINKENAFALVDDLMEPFRPSVDAMVWSLRQAGVSEITPDVKKRLVGLLNFRIDDDGESRNFSDFLFSYAKGVAQAMLDGQPRLGLPRDFMANFLNTNDI